MPYDSGVIQAAASYVLHGLNPGGFVLAILSGEDDKILLDKAHPVLRYTLGGKAFRNTVALVRAIAPEESQGSEEKVNMWMNHSGLDGAPDSVLVHFRLANRFDFSNLLNGIVEN